jgi:hypothetical protein
VYEVRHEDIYPSLVPAVVTRIFCPSIFPFGGKYSRLPIASERSAGVLRSQTSAGTLPVGLLTIVVARSIKALTILVLCKRLWTVGSIAGHTMYLGQAKAFEDAFM